MANDIICTCCHHKIDEDSLPVCSYCGFLNMVSVGNFKQADDSALKHRRDLVAKLKDISVAGYQYGWNDASQKYEQISRKVYKIADGLDCDGKIVWSSIDFGQWWDEKERSIPIEITYKYGQAWKVTRKFLPIESKNFWHIGVGISKDLQLVIYFGSESNYVESSGIDFICPKAKTN